MSPLRAVSAQGKCPHGEILEHKGGCWLGFGRDCLAGTGLDIRIALGSERNS